MVDRSQLRKMQALVCRRFIGYFEQNVTVNFKIRGQGHTANAVKS